MDLAIEQKTADREISLRCFGEKRFWSSNRNCLVGAARNAAYLLLDED